ncbi:response regulator transcription factor [Trichothermofontia sichuanensis B231]|uniref:response regulator transcription factor n=1 Tax=Trichothermofontia sichuanensis TaxID=3045816 RepID=UPI00224809A7|nr:response regulator transcription factor [Trichothermofontia sichuanensis]UZQ52795.1 response regulator transcription factor [Trichothermofontia sichuanensis B231]
MRQLIKILIVEDDPVMRLGLEYAFAKHPQIQIVDQCFDGETAVALALQFQPDVVLMDIGLPHLDGIAATQQIKAKKPGLRIMIFTSHKTEQETIAALSSGADAYCIKGTSLDKLLMAISCIQDGGIYLDPQIAHCVVKNLKSPVSSQPSATLSAREFEVLQLLVEGYSNPEIAQILYISASTVKAHIRSIMNKLAVDDRVGVAVAALRAGLL